MEDDQTRKRLEASLEQALAALSAPARQRLERFLKRVLAPLALWPAEEKVGVKCQIAHHLLEWVTELREHGLTDDEAVEEATQQLGDAKKIGRELGLARCQGQDLPRGDLFSAVAWAAPGALAAAFLTGVLSDPLRGPVPSWWALGLILFPAMSGLYAGIFSPRACMLGTLLAMLLTALIHALLDQSPVSVLVIGPSTVGWVAAALSRQFARPLAYRSLLASFPDQA